MSCRLTCIFFLLSLNVFSQQDKPDKLEEDSIHSAAQANDSIRQQKDLGDIFTGKIFHPFFGKPDSIARQQGKLYKAILPSIGYSPETQFFFGISLAASFYTD